MRLHFIYIQVLFWLLTIKEISPLQNEKNKIKRLIIKHYLDKLYLPPKLDMRSVVSTNPFSPDDYVAEA